MVPIAGGALGIVQGPRMAGGLAMVPADLDSHFRYLSGLLLGIGVAFLSCVPRIEAQGARFRLLGWIVIVGGLARLVSVADTGPPGPAHLFALGMELGVVPLLMLWQRRVERQFG